MKRNLENLYVPVNRATNDTFREKYDEIKQHCGCKMGVPCSCEKKTGNYQDVAKRAVGCDVGQFLE